MPADRSPHLPPVTPAGRSPLPPPPVTPAGRSPCLPPAGLIAGILPATVAAAESIGDLPGAGQGLFPAEEAALRTAGPRRRAEFTAGAVRQGRAGQAGRARPHLFCPAGPERCGGRPA